MAESGERDFDALLRDHADVRAAYRAASVDDQPPASLDAAILAASRRAVNAGPGRVDRSRRLVGRMAVPLSAAAVMVLATSLSFLVYEERGTPSAPEPSRAVRAPASDAATASGADKAAAASAPAAPAAAPIGSPRSASMSERQEQSQRRGAPSAGNTESVGPAPAAAPSAEAQKPRVVARSEAAADAPSAPMPSPGEEREAAAARYAETASERASVRNEVQASIAQAESARAVSSGSATEGVDQARQAGRPVRRFESRDDGVTGSPSAASIPAEAPAATSAKRLALPARERAMDSVAPEEARPKSAVFPEASPAAWIVRIRDLMETGRVDAARTEVARLRCRHPDIVLPADLPAPKAGAACPAPAAKEGAPDLR